MGASGKTSTATKQTAEAEAEMNSFAPGSMLDFSNLRGADGRRVEQRSYEIKEIWDSHQEILRRLSLGQKGTTIARDLGISAAVVSYVRNSELGKQVLSQLQGIQNKQVVNVRKRINELAPRAVKVLEDVLDGELSDCATIKERTSVAVDLLDRAGYGSKKPVSGVQVNVVTSDLLKRVREQVERGTIVSNAEEASYSESDFESDFEGEESFTDDSDEEQECSISHSPALLEV